MSIGITNKFLLGANKVATSTTVLAPLGLLVPVVPNQKVHLKYWLPFTEAAGTAGIGFELLTPAAVTSYLLSFFINNLVATHVAVDNAALLSAAALFTGTGANAGNYLATIEATIINGVNGGNLDLMFAQKVSDAGATTVLAGGYLEVTYF
jgi:hypothetical protein